jgi:hypothetical protein
MHEEGFARALGHQFRDGSDRSYREGDQWLKVESR